jgi:hypothetical protein
MTVPTTLEQTPLTAADRCDRCGARAYVMAVQPGGAELLFCKHHGRLYASGLQARGFELRGDLDYTDDLDSYSTTSNDIAEL